MAGEDSVELNPEFKPREYQLELYEKAVSNNSIIFLPTGSGKTFISALLIKHYAKDVLTKFTEGGKRIFFLVNTVALVTQQAESIRHLLPLTVKEYAGYMKVDFWDKEKWHAELDSTEVLVMTSQIFLNLLCHGYLKLTYVALLIFDECHHARQNHSMKQIMEQFKGYMGLPDIKLPRICGLTATLLIGNSKPSTVLSDIHSLEVTMMSNVITAVNTEMVRVYSTSAKINTIEYSPMSNPIYLDAVDEWIEESCKEVSSIQLKEYENIQVIGTLVTDESRDARKAILKMFKSFKHVVKNLGVYGTYIAALVKLVRYHKHAISETSENRFLVYLAITKLLELRAILKKFMTGEESKWPSLYSSPKFLKLLLLALKMRKESSTVVFVEQRITAQTISYIFKQLCKETDYSTIVRPEHMVGFAGNPCSLDRYSVLENKCNLETLRSFNKGECNWLVASSVIEEGIDVRICDNVIKFDFPNTYRSYIQSKGRARHENSMFYIFLERTQYSMLQSFQQLEEYIKSKMVSSVPTTITKEEVDAQLFSPEITPYFTLGKTGPCVTAATSVQLIYRYCNALPHDVYTRSVPYWSKLEELISGQKKVCVFLQLPLNSPIKSPLQGPWCTTFNVAKRSVALNMCRKLHQLGELNDNLLPSGSILDVVCEKELLPYWDYDDTSHPSLFGTSKNFRFCKKKIPDVLRRSTTGTYYLHIINMMPVEKATLDEQKYSVFSSILKFPFNYGMITTNPFPTLLSFLMGSLFEHVLVNISVNVETMQLTDSQIDELTNFHKMVFRDVTKFFHQAFISVPFNDDLWYLIVPCFTSSNSFTSILWDVVKQHKEGLQFLDEKSSDIKLEDNLYLLRPKYRDIQDTLGYVYLQQSVLNPDSLVPNHRCTFREYFADKYDVTLSKDAVLVDARGVSNRIDFVTPRKTRSKCSVVQLPLEILSFPNLSSAFFIKGALLPSAIFRIHTLLLAEELRAKIYAATGQGFCSEESVSRVLYTPVVEEVNRLPSLSKRFHELQITNQNSQIKFPDEAHVSPHDIQSIFDLLDDPSEVPIGSERKFVFEKVKVQPISLLSKHDLLSGGPDMGEILNAFTAPSMADFLNYERLELLGDSFLKYIVTLALFTYFPDKDEGKLSSLKSKMIGNQHLMYCALYHGLDKCILSYRFSRLSIRIPGFNLPDKVLQLLKEGTIDETVFFDYQFTAKDIDGQDYSRECYELLRTLSKTKEKAQDKHKEDYNYHQISDKVIADVVESLIGCYLSKSGILSAATVCQWLGVLSKGYFKLDKLLYEPAPSPLIDETKTIPKHFMLHKLEAHIGYKFNNVAFLVQALTHASYTKSYTDCYQRLELLGDSILDFLLTAYIYESCPSLGPGELTDLRSALVNNNIFACYAVQLELYRFLLAESCELSKAIQKFIVYQIISNFEIESDIHLKIAEDESGIGKDIEVPKVLGDLFEAFIGSIYLDSGKNLEACWLIIYKIMHKEIESYKHNIPKNPIRMLYEMCAPSLPVFGEVLKLNNSQYKVSLEVVTKSTREMFMGMGRNTSSAKRAAAKLALKKLMR